MSSSCQAEHNSQGPAGYPFIGHLLAFLSDKLGFLSRCAATYGEVIKLKIGGSSTFLINNPEDIKHILIVNPDNYFKSPRMTSAGGKRLSGAGLLTSVGAAHLKQRRMMQPVFYRKTVENFSKIVTEGIEQMLAQWANRSELDLSLEMMGLVQRNIVRSVMGIPRTWTVTCRPCSRQSPYDVSTWNTYFFPLPLPNGCRVQSVGGIAARCSALIPSCIERFMRAACVQGTP